MTGENFYTVRGYQLLNAQKRILTSSMEDYMEMIYRICIVEGYVRVNQLSEYLNVRPSSTTKIVQKLERLGMINYQRYGIIRLTETGREIGSFLLGRHSIIESFFKVIGMEETVLEDTEKIEHDISISTLNCFRMLDEFFSNNQDVLERYNRFKENFKFENPDF